MRNWETLEPDVYRLMDKHYTPGRSRPIRKIVIHHNAGCLSIEDCWQVWQTREASAHYQIEASGRVGQMVNDWDTAWHAANATINAESIGIEHANSAGSANNWPISQATRETGAHLVAALCHAYNLGRPRWGVNVFGHSDFWGTSCPYRLAVGGDYHNEYMNRAAWWYDHMAAGNQPTHNEKKGVFMALSDNQQNELYGWCRDIFTQLRGLGGHGWPQLGKNSKGENLTLVDAVAALRGQVNDLAKKIEGGN